MSDRTIRKHLAITLVDEMKQDLLKACAAAAEARTIPPGNASYQEWTFRQEGKLALLEDYRQQLLKRDGLDVIAVAEGTA